MLPIVATYVACMNNSNVEIRIAGSLLPAIEKQNNKLILNLKLLMLSKIIYNIIVHLIACSYCISFFAGYKG